ncbi:GNAT family N-acetyltransferase [Chengkuizengella axinellae]|uniref:GNAT family N-acetyltransferase n=1 Tax=Chengkuizengella axinellae TaxID=3064388 RepID=A0ABT9J104_9BACL|nr:GNAT family N-acetyltransferase [Chengkuizengella sp. 2205SS18-9]MDP5275306.1 GNAT family N-acetyltransferase [Chengkuizengella sp. 2205SS18-9]
MINIKNRIEQPTIIELLAFCAGSSSDRVEQTVEDYKEQNELELYGFEAEGKVIGIIGYRMHENQMELKHIAVSPEQRYKGIGSLMINAMMNLTKSDQVIAETDDDAVDFYRSSGFTIYSLGEKYPGVERYRCEFEVE